VDNFTKGMLKTKKERKGMEQDKIIVPKGNNKL
jgi:hypothetical protein